LKLLAQIGTEGFDIEDELPANAQGMNAARNCGPAQVVGTRPNFFIKNDLQSLFGPYQAGGFGVCGIHTSEGVSNAPKRKSTRHSGAKTIHQAASNTAPQNAIFQPPQGADHQGAARHGTPPAAPACVHLGTGTRQSPAGRGSPAQRTPSISTGGTGLRSPRHRDDADPGQHQRGNTPRAVPGMQSRHRPASGPAGRHHLPQSITASTQPSHAAKAANQAGQSIRHRKAKKTSLFSLIGYRKMAFCAFFANLIRALYIYSQSTSYEDNPCPENISLSKHQKDHFPIWDIGFLYGLLIAFWAFVPFVVHKCNSCTDHGAAWAFSLSSGKNALGLIRESAKGTQKKAPRRRRNDKSIEHQPRGRGKEIPLCTEGRHQCTNGQARPGGQGSRGNRMHARRLEAVAVGDTAHFSPARGAGCAYQEAEGPADR